MANYKITRMTPSRHSVTILRRLPNMEAEPQYPMHTTQPEPPVFIDSRRTHSCKCVAEANNLGGGYACTQ